MTHSSSPLHFYAQATTTLQGSVRVPGDKSISHRAIMLGSIAHGTTHIQGFLEGEDALCTMNAFRAMGVAIDGPHQGQVQVHGVGLHGLQAPSQALDCGNSGTSMRLLAGLLAGQHFSSTLCGDASLSKRPMRRVIDPLSQMGAVIQANPADPAVGRPPLHIRPGSGLQAIHYTLPMASAQVKSSVLLAGLYAQGVTSVTEPEVTRDHTERMLRGFGVKVEQNPASHQQTAGPNGSTPHTPAAATTVRLQGGQSLRATTIDIPADISSAAFFMVAASICPEADITLRHVGINPTRTGIIDILRLMGADLTVTPTGEMGGEPVADIRVRSAALRGISIPAHLVPLAIDEFPVVFVAAANATGTTTLTGAAELRVKESDRIAVMAQGLQQCGVDAQPTLDGMVIGGLGSKPGLRYQAASIDAQGDHRIAMSFVVAAIRAQGTMHITGAETVNTSFPGFVALAQSLGFALSATAPGQA